MKETTHAADKTAPDGFFRPDVTDEESERNFKRQSLLNQREVVALLTDWIRRIDENELEVELKPEAAAVLRRAVCVMRDRIVNKGLPTITRRNVRYEVTLFHDMLQLGIVTFADGDRFDEEGRPIPVLVDDDAEETCGQTDDGTSRPDTQPYTLIEKVALPWYPIDKWAEINGVKPGTARQWANRGRIRSDKSNGVLEVPAIQYTPDAFARARTTVYRFHMIEDRLPADIVEKHRQLHGSIYDMLIVPSAALDGGDDRCEGKPYAGLVIRRPGKDPRLEAEQWGMDAAEREELIEALYAVDGISPQCDKYYKNPLGSDLPVPGSKHPELIPLINPDKIVLSGYVVSCAVKSAGSAATWEDYTDKTHEAAPRFEMTIGTDKKPDMIRLKGHLIHTEQNARLDLLRAIFGQDGPMDAVRTICHKAGIPRTMGYPWDRSVALITELSLDRTAKKTGDTAVLLRQLPHILKNHAAFEPDLVMFSLIDGKLTGVLTGAGYACCQERRPRQRALFYAYAPAVRRTNHRRLTPATEKENRPDGLYQKAGGKYETPAEPENDQTNP